MPAWSRMRIYSRGSPTAATRPRSPHSSPGTGRWSGPSRRRHCGDPHLAADAEQGVWPVLARRAASVSSTGEACRLAVRRRRARRPEGRLGSRPPLPRPAPGHRTRCGGRRHGGGAAAGARRGTGRTPLEAESAACALLPGGADPGRGGRGRAGHASGSPRAGWSRGREAQVRRRLEPPGVAPAVASGRWRRC